MEENIIIVVVVVVDDDDDDVVNVNSVELYRRSRITDHKSWKSVYLSLNSRK